MPRDEPEQAKWLTPAQKALVRADLEAERRSKEEPSVRHGGMLSALRNPKVWIVGLCARRAYWTPRIIAEAGVGDVLNLGFVSAIPPLLGIVVMLLVGRHSDRTLERRWHAAVSWLVAAAAMLALAFSGGSVLVVVVLLVGVKAKDLKEKHG